MSRRSSNDRCRLSVNAFILSPLRILHFSLKHKDYAFFGKTICIRKRIMSHNSGYSTIRGENTSRLCPFAVMAYICGFNADRELQKHIRSEWEDKKNELCLNGIMEPREWAMSAASIIDSSCDKDELKLVYLFQ